MLKREILDIIKRELPNFTGSPQSAETLLERVSIQLDALKVDEDRTIQAVREFNVILAGYKLKARPDFSDKDDIYLRLKLILEEVFELIEACGFIHNNKLRRFIADKIFPGLQVELSAKFEDQTAEAKAVDVLDALVDIRYVADGAAIAFGLDTFFDEAFAIIHKNNMGKLLYSRDMAEENKKWYAEQYVEVDIVPIIYNERMCFLLKCSHDASGKWAKGKVLKPKGFKPVHLKSLF